MSNFPSKPTSAAPRGGLGTVIRKLFRDAATTHRDQSVTLEKGLTLQVPGDGTLEITLTRTMAVMPSWNEARAVATAAGWATADIRQRDGDGTRLPYIILREERRVL